MGQTAVLLVARAVNLVPPKPHCAHRSPGELKMPLLTLHIWPEDLHLSSDTDAARVWTTL